MPIDTHYHPEFIHDTAFVASGAVIVGQVCLGAHSSVWYNAVLRGDIDRIDIGERTNIQDGAILHVDAGSPCSIGSGVTIGHKAVVHGARVADDVLIGIGAIVLSGAQIGADSIIGAGALVTGGTVVPPRSLVLGVPGRVVRSLTDTEVESIKAGAARYVAYSAAYQA